MRWDYETDHIRADIIYACPRNSRMRIGQEKLQPEERAYAAGEYSAWPEQGILLKA